jgi:hypothetical protein
VLSPKKSHAQNPNPLSHLGDKKPERRITSFNSASQFRVIKLGEVIDSPADCQSGFDQLVFSSAVAEEQNKTISC